MSKFVSAAHGAVIKGPRFDYSFPFVINVDQKIFREKVGGKSAKKVR